MVKRFRELLGEEISANGFTLKAKDAHDFAKNINFLFMQRSSWFSKPKPIHIAELCKLYKELCPDMEMYFPGVIDKSFHPTIITKLGYPVDALGMVHWEF
jgi:hypothetical protein